MLGIQPEYLVGFSMLLMGAMALFLGTRSQKVWNEYCYNDWHRNPVARRVNLFIGPVLMAFGIAIFAGFMPF